MDTISSAVCISTAYQLHINCVSCFVLVGNPWRSKERVFLDCCCIDQRSAQRKARRATVVLMKLADGEFGNVKAWYSCKKDDQLTYANEINEINEMVFYYVILFYGVYEFYGVYLHIGGAINPLHQVMALKSMAGILKRSQRLLVIWDPTYVQRCRSRAKMG